MALTRYLDKGALLGRERPCLTAGENTLSYGDVVDLSHRVARALQGSGVAPGDKVGILSANDPTAFACVFGIARRGAPPLFDIHRSLCSLPRYASNMLGNDLECPTYKRNNDSD